MRLSYAILRLLCQLIYIFLFRGRVWGLRNVPRRGGVLLVSNHQSYLDPVLATLAIPRECHYMARDTLFLHPFLRGIIQFLNAYPVRRDTADVAAIKQTIRRLRAGNVVLAFPEGTRTPDGRLGELRAGVIMLARKTGVPIVPVLIEGAFRAWPRTAKLPRPGRILVAYGEPIRLDEHPDWTDGQCVQAVRAAILDLQQRFAPRSAVAGNRCCRRQAWTA